MFGGQAKADRRTVVHQVQAVSLDTQPIDEGLHEDGQVVEAVVEAVQSRLVAVPESGVVRRHEVEPVGQRRNQVAEHVRGGWESVQQQDGRGIGRTGLAVEDLDAIDLDGLVQGLPCNLRRLRDGFGACGRRSDQWPRDG